MTLPNLDVLAYEESPIGMIRLQRRELLLEPGTVVTEILLDHAMLMSSCNSASERALASSALDMRQGEDLRVLVGGLGLGYTAQEVLASHRVAHVEVVEFLPQVVGWFERGLLPLADELKADPRFATSVGDVYARLAAAPEETHDLILVDVDHSPDENLAAGNDAFYGEEGLARARKHLAPEGVLGVWSYAESPSFERALRRTFGEVRVEEVRFTNRLVGDEEANWLYFARG
jgi:spermidine synthase